jgi:hypothetical protein
VEILEKMNSRHLMDFFENIDMTGQLSIRDFTRGIKKLGFDTNERYYEIN